jgi:hypothetical protein
VRLITTKAYNQNWSDEKKVQNASHADGQFRAAIGIIGKLGLVDMLNYLVFLYSKV